MFLSVHKGRVRSAWLSALCFAGCLIVNLVWPLGCLAADASPGGRRTVTIASEGARPPYNCHENNELTDFEIDLARDLCARMKVSCSYIAQDWDGQIRGLLEHRYDGIVAAMEIMAKQTKKSRLPNLASACLPLS